MKVISVRKILADKTGTNIVYGFTVRLFTKKFYWYGITPNIEDTDRYKYLYEK